MTLMDEALCRWFLSDSRVAAVRTEGGNWPHCAMVLGKKENLYVSLCVWMCLKLFVFRVLLSECCNRCGGGLAATKLFVILWSIINRALRLLVLSSGHFKSLSISVTELWLLFLFVTNRAARRCTFSICWIWVSQCGSHTDEAYSNLGRTIALYAWSFAFLTWFWGFF